MKIAANLALICLFMSISFFGCYSEKDSFFGLQLEEDADSPFVMITSPQTNTNLENTRHIELEYKASDLSGIKKIGFYANKKFIYEITGSEINGKLTWNWETSDSIRNNLDLQLSATDGTGKVSWSNIVSINLDYTVFEEINMSGYKITKDSYTLRPDMKIAYDNSLWFLTTGNKLLHYANGQFTEVQVKLPYDPYPGSSWIPYVDDFYISRSGAVYAACNTTNSVDRTLLYPNMGLVKEYRNPVYSFTEDKDGKVYCILGNRAILRIDESKGIDTIFQVKNNSWEQIVELAFDPDNNLYYYDEPQFKVFKKTASGWETIINTYSNEMPLEIVFDKYSNFYALSFASFQEPVFFVNKDKVQLQKGLLDRFTDFTVIDRNEIWFTSEKGLIRYKDNTYKIFTNLNSNIKGFSRSRIISDRNGNIYAYFGETNQLIVIRPGKL